MIACLCVHRAGVYSSFPGCDLWDETRDASTYRGNDPVLGHPPCRLWAGLEHFAKPTDSAKERALGIRVAGLVVANGGVLEHPARSRLFRAAGLPHPGEFSPLGFTLDIDQLWFGHQARKRTWLFVSGVSREDLPAIPFALVPPTTRPIEFQSKRQREATPFVLAAWLVSVAALVRREVAA